MQGKMKCGVFYDVGDVKLEERDIPQITERDILVKTLRAGICGSDTGAYTHGGLRYGIYKSYPFGHEFIGRVVEKGAAVPAGIEVGDLVFVDPTRAKRGGKFLADVCGAFTEYVCVENAALEDNVYPLKKDVDLDAAALIEPLSVGTQGVLCTHPQPEDNVVILGAGTIGLCAAAGAVNHGLKNVIVVDRNDWKLEKAAALGAKTVNSKTENLNDKLVEYCGEYVDKVMDPRYVDPKIFEIMGEMMGGAAQRVAGKKPNVQLFVDCAGAKDLLMESLTMCAEGTKYAIVSVYAEPLTFDGSMFMSQPVIQGSSGYTHDTIKEVIDHLENERTPIKNIVTAKFPISRFEEAMEKAARKEYKNIKVLIDYEME